MEFLATYGSSVKEAFPALSVDWESVDARICLQNRRAMEHYSNHLRARVFAGWMSLQEAGMP